MILPTDGHLKGIRGHDFEAREHDGGRECGVCDVDSVILGGGGGRGGCDCFAERGEDVLDPFCDTVFWFGVREEAGAVGGAEGEEEF